MSSKVKQTLLKIKIKFTDEALVDKLPADVQILHARITDNLKECTICLDEAQGEKFIDFCHTYKPQIEMEILK